MFKVKRHIYETSSTKTVRFDGSLGAIPGQFAMVWVPGVDEFPMSVSYPGRDFGITYQILGEGTKALGKKRAGEIVGIRGSYGNGFTVSKKRLLVVAGGLGMAPLAPLIELARKKKATVDLVIGARTSKELLFERRAKAAGATVEIATDDGTKGFKGFASELARELIEKSLYDCVYTCGPEKMMVKVFDIASREGIPVQASLERIMKCGIGICDSCAIDGVHVCKDGPVFSSARLGKFKDFGRTKLDPAGRKVPV